jgi:hypothetical protein
MHTAISLLRSGHLLEDEQGNFYYMDDDRNILRAVDGDIYSRNYKKIPALPCGNYKIVEE